MFAINEHSYFNHLRQYKKNNNASSSYDLRRNAQNSSAHSLFLLFLAASALLTTSQRCFSIRAFTPNARPQYSRAKSLNDWLSSSASSPFTTDADESPSTAPDDVAVVSFNKLRSVRTSSSNRAS